VTRTSLDALALSRKLIRGLVVVNLLLGVGIFVMLVMTFAAQEFLFRAIGARSAADSTVLVMGFRVVMVLGLFSIPLSHLILRRLQAIVETVQLGPFIRENADRLRTMGWALLGLEALHFGVGIAAKALAFAGIATGTGWSFSATRWLAVLMLFVLARVFEQGIAMREDLEGTV
jgi:hypothetical protein